MSDFPTVWGSMSPRVCMQPWLNPPVSSFPKWRQSGLSHPWELKMCWQLEFSPDQLKLNHWYFKMPGYFFKAPPCIWQKGSFWTIGGKPLTRIWDFNLNLKVPKMHHYMIPIMPPLSEIPLCFKISSSCKLQQLLRCPALCRNFSGILFVIGHEATIGTWSCVKDLLCEPSVNRHYSPKQTPNDIRI